MGHAYDAICRRCGTTFGVSEGSGMIAMPFHCDRCGKEWWWEFGPGGPVGKEPELPRCECGGIFKVDAPARCPKCGSPEFEKDPNGLEMIYDWWQARSARSAESSRISLSSIRAQPTGMGGRHAAGRVEGRTGAFTWNDGAALNMGRYKRD